MRLRFLVLRIVDSSPFCAESAAQAAGLSAAGTLAKGFADFENGTWCSFPSLNHAYIYILFVFLLSENSFDFKFKIS